MKKYLIAFLVLLTGFTLTSQVLSAEDVETGDVVIHFKTWSGDYDGLGRHGWDGIDKKSTFDGEDDFGVYVEGKDIPLTNEIGFIAVYFDNETDVEPNWKKKLTGDIKIKPNTLVAGETTHIYVFEGAETKGNDLGYYVAKNDEFNMLLVYADPSGAYEENIGVYAWNGWTNATSDWGSPAKVFTKGASHSAIKDIKVAMLHSTSAEAGLLIYAGGDGNKKTGDVKLEDALGADPVLGDVGFAYVVSKGNAYEAGDNVYYDAAPFIEEAFTFRLLPMGTDKIGNLTGTYAPRPDQVFVELSAQVTNPYKEMETVEDEEVRVHTDAEAKLLVESWFTVSEGENEVVVKEVQFAMTDDTLGTFVLILDGYLDNTKEYMVKFDLGLVGDDNRMSELEIALDKNGPEVTFIGPLEIIGKEAKDRVILVAWGKKFNQNLFPTFRIADDRDGDLTKHFWIPKGENSVLDTSVEGDYTIMIKVEDTWGNVTEETFIFRVSKKVKYEGQNK